MWYSGLFGKTFYINLDRSKKRNASVLNTIKNLGITDYQRFSAVSEENWKDRCDLPYDMSLRCASKHYQTPGSFLACCSKLLLYQFIIKEDYEEPVLILEDDAILAPDFFERIEGIVEDLKSVKWNIAYLFDVNQKYHRRKFSSGLIHLKSSYAAPFHAQIIKPHIFKKLVEVSDPFIRVKQRFYQSGDKRVMFASQGLAYAVSPSLVTQSVPLSSIIQDRDYWDSILREPNEYY